MSFRLRVDVYVPPDVSQATRAALKSMAEEREHEGLQRFLRARGIDCDLVHDEHGWYVEVRPR